MKKKGLVGLIVGVTAGVAAAVAGGLATKKVVKEIKDDLSDYSFESEDGKNVVTLTYGSSDFAKGLTYVQVRAFVKDSDLDCKMVVFAIKNTEIFDGEWIDGEHFTLKVGSGKRKQCCDVDFSDDEINMYYYVEKTTEDEDIIECEVADDDEIEAIELAKEAAEESTGATEE
ncbi:MAG: hypothetical protein IKA62_06915 [Clostridia bacterium]|nr:hypothetical protein [Clostridia bacterium]